MKALADNLARFVSGFLYGGMYHAWAEVYLPRSGWIPVDPRMGAWGVSLEELS